MHPAWGKLPALILAASILAACAAPTATTGPSATTPTTGLRVAPTAATVLSTGSPVPVDQSVVVELAPQNNSGISGRATLSDMGSGRTRVQVQITGSTTEHPAHIHEGTCQELNPAPKWPLENVQNGNSTTEVSASLDEILRQPTAINLHRSAQDVQTYVACGNVARTGPGGSPTAR